MLAQLDAFWQDLTYAVRQLKRSPGFAAVAIASLGLGIGANVAMYGIARAILRRPPNAARPEELVRVYRGEHSPLPRDWFLHFSRNSRTLAQLIAEDPMALGVDRGDTPERVLASVVSENFFPALGLAPAVGTVFAGAPGDLVGQVAVLSHAYWSARFGADPTVVGRTVRLNDQAFTILGVAPAGFRSSQLGWAPSVFVPLSEQARLRGDPPGSGGGSSFYITGRLAAGRTPGEAQGELTTLAATLPNAPPEALEPGAFRVEQARGVTAEIRTPATVASAFLMAVVGLVLLIACANLANLLLARGVARRREIAIRTAIGVSRPRLIRQLLTESVVLAGLGGAAGVALAWYVTRLIPRLIPQRAEMAFDIAVDLNVLLFAALLAVATGVLFGLAPALTASRPDVQRVLREDTGGGSRRSRLRSAFLVGQVALATVLLVTAARFLTSLGRAQAIDPGFRSERVADLGVDLSVRQYDDDRGQTFYQEALERVRALPGVESASLIGMIPLGGSNSGTGVLPGSADPNDERAVHGTTFTTVTAGYFEMFGIPLASGRTFDLSDRAAGAPVVMVNESFARMLWPDAEAVGQTMRFAGGDVSAPAATVVGVVRDTKYLRLTDHNVPVLYLPLPQNYSNTMVLQVRLAGDTPAEREAVRRAVQGLDPALPLSPVRSMRDDMAIILLPARAGAGLLGGFGGLALLLATIGVYGVTAFLVSQRTREIGVRTALGATARDVLRLMMRDTLTLVTVGLGLGLAGGIGVGAVISTWLYGVGALDPRPLAGAGAVLVTVALLGTWLPARRALRVDPVRALRTE
jgi:predicted permease